MGNINLLKEIIADSGMTMVSIAKKSGILRATLYNRLNGKSEFTASEIEGITAALRLDKCQRDQIFFGD